VKRIVQRIAANLPASVEREDLINAGVIGLIQSAERFDASQKNTFQTYAQQRIRGAVLSELRARDHFRRPTRKRLKELEKTQSLLEQKTNGDVSEEDLANAMGLTIEKVHEIRSMACLRFIRLEDLGILSHQEKMSAYREMEVLHVPDAYENAHMKEVFNTLRRAIERLPHKEKMVISLYYADELSMKEIGEVLEITESRVSQIHAAAILRLRRRLRLKGHVSL
jgi:RNA polymerase sigma factor for flagellar operon FliA